MKSKDSGIKTDVILSIIVFLCLIESVIIIRAAGFPEEGIGGYLCLSAVLATMLCSEVRFGCHLYYHLGFGITGKECFRRYLGAIGLLMAVLIFILTVYYLSFFIVTIITFDVNAAKEMTGNLMNREKVFPMITLLVPAGGTVLLTSLLFPAKRILRGFLFFLMVSGAIAVFFFVPGSKISIPIVFIILGIIIHCGAYGFLRKGYRPA